MSAFSVHAIPMPEEPGSVDLKITGPMNVSSVGELLMQLLAAYDRSESVTIDLSGVTEIDAAGLQLFCSCHRSSIFSNKEFGITGQEQPAIRTAAEAMGCLRKSGCALGTEHSCIWTAGQIENGMARRSE
jgi:ABC-type transporter Mla MlaB component